MLESQTDFFKRKYKGFYMVYTVIEKSGKTKKIKVREVKNLLKALGLLFLQYSKAGTTYNSQCVLNVQIILLITVLSVQIVTDKVRENLFLVLEKSGKYQRLFFACYILGKCI